MSLPWKNSKPGRISRFMSEFQQSPKRGLVVETGFPTSLIDLFVKHRDRLKKSSSKRLKRQYQTAPDVSSAVIPDAYLAEKPAKKESVQNKNEKTNILGGGLTAENKHAVYKKRRVCDSGVGGSGGSCVLTAFKVLLVAFFALSTNKKFSAGITLSTLAILLTELVAARVFTRSKLRKTDRPRGKPVVSVHGEKTKTFDDSSSCLKKTEHVTEKQSSKDSTIRCLLLKDEKPKSKTSKLKSKIMKKLKSYSKKKKTETIVTKEETLSKVSSFVSDDKAEIVESVREEKEPSNPTLMGTKAGANGNGMVVIVIVLTSLLCGKIFAIVLTLSCLFLRFQAATRFGRCI